MAQALAAQLGTSEAEILVSSTGVIGQHMPIEKIEAGVRTSFPLLSETGGSDAAEAIMTTDTFAKEAAVTFLLDGVKVTMGGMAKGSGMIAPNMATMLSFISTDAKIAPWLLQEALGEATKRSFNRITVDGDTSTNDMVIVLANGMAGNRELSGVNDPAFAQFYNALEYLLVKLSKMIVLDGEGATKFVEIVVTGAKSEEEADRAARSVANSSLVKTAIHGEDANWGRILAAVGYSGIDFNPAETTVHFGDVPILKRNYDIAFSEEEAAKVLARKEIAITVDLHQGSHQAIFWTCDLSKEYVNINANYRS
jgi:glutamate N-acetyltransferase/amino-acid N-acetyltransferase